MKIIIVRHADPDYSIDSLTEKGWKEAEFLAERLKDIKVKDFYVSPMGRARDTASLTLKKMGRKATVCDWLREFSAPIKRPDGKGELRGTWDWLPGDWTLDERLFTYDKWQENEIMIEGNVKKEYDWVAEELDRLIEKYGYKREGKLYRAVKPNCDTIVFFCHFGVECVLLSHLLNVSPMILWHGFCAAPSSVTIVATEERREGLAYFRTLTFGDTSHLYSKGEPPAFSARFCECFKNEDERHD